MRRSAFWATTAYGERQLRVDQSRSSRRSHRSKGVIQRRLREDLPSWLWHSSSEFRLPSGHYSQSDGERGGERRELSVTTGKRGAVCNPTFESLRAAGSAIRERASPSQGGGLPSAPGLGRHPPDRVVSAAQGGVRVVLARAGRVRSPTGSRGHGGSSRGSESTRP